MVERMNWIARGCVDIAASYGSLSTTFLKMCKNWGFHGVDYEECSLLGFDAVRIL
jgi:hypothetical protein